MAVVQKPFNLSIFTENSGPPAWKQVPTWYQVSENDRMIPPAVEQMFAKQMNATTISLPASHASLESHPNEIAQLILNATHFSYTRCLNTHPKRGGCRLCHTLKDRYPEPRDYKMRQCSSNGSKNNSE